MKMKSAHWGTPGRSSVWLSVILFIALVWGASTAQASLILGLSAEFSGATPPEGTPPWLNATFEDSVVPDEVTLTLSTPNLTDAESVKEWAFNLDPLLDPTNLVFSEASRTGSFEPASPDITTGTNFWQADGDGYFDIKITFSNQDGPPMRFGDGDGVVYTITGISGLTADSFDFISEPDGGGGEYKTVAHVLGIGPTDDQSGWVATPEPATLGVLLIGSLALLRKRKA